MARVACLMMQKDEGELLRVWIEYHRQLFGLHNLFLYDNASSDALTLRILDKYRDMGMSVNRSYLSSDAHTKRGEIFGEMIRYLDRCSGVDFVFPIDCDEFLIYRDTPTTVSGEPAIIHEQLGKLINEKQALGIDGTYYNILGQPDHFFDWPQRKTFFRTNTFGSMDSGFHEGRSRLAEGKKPTRFRYMHYHHKPYGMLVEHSKNKLRAFFDPDDISQLAAPENRNRLSSFILDGEQSYMNKFKTDQGLYLTGFRLRLDKIGLKMPF